MGIFLIAAAAASAHISVLQQAKEQSPTFSVQEPGSLNFPLAGISQPLPLRRQEAATPLSPRFSAPTAERGAISLPSVDWANGKAALKMKVVGIHLGWIF